MFGDYTDIFRTIGILSTPVINRDDESIFLVCFEVDDGAPDGVSHRLYKISLQTGEDLAGPTTITGSVAGSGPDEGPPGLVTFKSFYQTQRASLTLQDDILYFGFGSRADVQPYHGWVFAYATTSSSAITPLLQLGIYCTSPNSLGGGVWQSGAAALADATGTYWVSGGSPHVAAWLCW